MAHPEHQPYWFKIGSGCGLLGLGMIALAGALASSTGHLDLLGPLMIVAYVAFAASGACFLLGVRHVRFPLAAKEHGPVTTLTRPALPSSGVVSPAQPTATSERRVKCRLSPMQLTRRYSRGETGLEGERLVAPYKGRWREVSVTVEDVEPTIGGYLLTVRGKDPDQVSVSFLFELGPWADRLGGPMKGAQIKVLGQVYLVNRTLASMFRDLDLSG